MQCEAPTEENGEQSVPVLNCLDSAMRKLEILTTFVNSGDISLCNKRRKSFGSKPNWESRKELSHPDVGIIHMNTRYVSNVTIGLRMKQTTNNRLQPYIVPERKRERHRTRSERSENYASDMKDMSDLIPQDTWMEHSSSYISVLDPKIGHSFTKKKKTILKKSQSLEDIRVENIESSQLSHEMEFVSSRIQKLKVME